MGAQNSRGRTRLAANRIRIPFFRRRQQMAWPIIGGGIDSAKAEFNPTPPLLPPRGKKGAAATILTRKKIETKTMKAPNLPLFPLFFFL